MNYFPSRYCSVFWFRKWSFTMRLSLKRLDKNWGNSDLSSSCKKSSVQRFATHNLLYTNSHKRQVWVKHASTQGIFWAQSSKEGFLVILIDVTDPISLKFEQVGEQYWFRTNEYSSLGCEFLQNSYSASKKNIRNGGKPFPIFFF